MLGEDYCAQFKKKMYYLNIDNILLTMKHSSLVSSKNVCHYKSVPFRSVIKYVLHVQVNFLKTDSYFCDCVCMNHTYTGTQGSQKTFE